MALKDLAEIFAPLASALAQKAAQLQQMCAIDEQVTQLTAKLAKATTDEEEQQITKKLDDLQNSQNCEWLAFASKSDQGRWLAASAYADEFSSIDQGRAYFRAYFLCMSGGSDHPCMSVMASKAWRRRFDDPLASKQRWFCLYCGARYRVRFGALIEILSASTGARYWARASCPDADICDARGLFHEQSFRATSPEMLYEQLPVLAPTVGDLLVPMPEYPGAARIRSRQDFDRLPFFEWSSLFTLVL
jgi:hypothetical protein